MIDLHVWLSSESSMCTWFDIDHTGDAYSVTDYHKFNDVVLIVLSFV